MKKLSSHNSGKSRIKNSVLSIVILVEIFALCVVGTFAWVETVSSIKITNEANTVSTIKNDTKYTDMMIGGESGTIDLLDYFEPSGDMHFAPASSADGKTFYFPKANISSNFIYRKGNVSDKNTTYLSASFRLKADTNADFFFWKDATHDINVSDDIRVSVTAYTEGDNPEGTYDPVSGRLISNTKIYANNASTTAVVNSTSGATGATTVEKFTDHQKGKSSTARLFAVGANETKIVTINVWLQKKTSGNTDITSNMSVSQAINNLGITSSLTPRHVTLLPTPTWDTGAQTYYAWCWTPNSNQKSRLYKLELNSEEEHYTFDYNGTYTKTTFVRAVPGCTVQPGEYDSWPFTLSTNSNDQNNNKYWNQTVDTSIPNDPVDPTYIIETISGGTDSKSTGSWHDPATDKVAYVTGQDSDCGTLTATSYIGSATSSHVIESTNSNSQKHKDTVHAWPGKLVSLTASAKTNYAFVGWYTDAAGTTPAPTVNSTAYTATNYKPNAPSTASEITYYAKFVETRKLTIYRYLDGSNVSTACGTITIAGTDSTSGTTATKTVNKGTSVSFSATAATGYTLDGIYTTATGTNTASSPVTLNSNTSYYARFTANSYNVTARAYYSNNGGSSYSSGSTGGTVTAGSSAAGATSTASVKYKNSVNLVATPSSGYQFVGWYSAATGGTQLSTNTTYSYTMNSTSTQNVYARFMGETWSLKYGVSGASSWNSVAASVSGNNVTATMTLTEGQDFSFQFVKSVGSTDTWYGGGGSYQNITSTSFISNKTLSVNGGDIYMKGHAGTYTFTFNKSTNVLNVTVSYSNITITFDY
ncbi:MAG: hypothetical protein IJI48_06940, partial [Ruminococcus sp.]|nr:hypothetical protein [Ruminococcus sp.]